MIFFVICTGIFDDSNGAENQDSLVAYEEHLTRTGHALYVAEQMWEYVGAEFEGVCKTFGSDPYCFGAGPGTSCFPNIPKKICDGLAKVTKGIYFGILEAVRLVHFAMEDNFESLG